MRLLQFLALLINYQIVVVKLTLLQHVPRRDRERQLNVSTITRVCQLLRALLEGS